MTHVDYPYAGLILPDAQDLDPEPYLDTAALVLSRLDPSPEARTGQAAQGNKVMGREFGVAVFPEEDSDYGPRVVIEIVSRDGSRPDDEASARILSEIVLAALEHSSADILEWYAPDVLLDRDDFLRLRSYVSPKRLRDVDAAMEDDLFDNAKLTQALRDNLDGTAKVEPEDDRPQTTDRLAAYRITLAPASPEERRMGVASALIAATVAIFSLPIAAFVYTVALVRGLDFRLISQAMAITALFVALYNADRLSGSLRMLIN